MAAKQMSRLVRTRILEELLCFLSSLLKMNTPSILLAKMRHVQDDCKIQKGGVEYISSHKMQSILEPTKRMQCRLLFLFKKRVSDTLELGREIRGFLGETRKTVTGSARELADDICYQFHHPNRDCFVLIGTYINQAEADLSLEEIDNPTIFGGLKWHPYEKVLQETKLRNILCELEMTLMDATEEIGYYLSKEEAMD